MKTATVFLLTLVLTGHCICGQDYEVVVDDQGFSSFQMKAEDTTYIMKQYFLVLLKKGAVRDQTEEESAQIQREHLDHINWMADQGYIDLAGPLGDDGDLRGILIMRVPDLATAREIAERDPAVKAGRLALEIHPWWAAKGSRLK